MKEKCRKVYINLNPKISLTIQLAQKPPFLIHLTKHGQSNTLFSQSTTLFAESSTLLFINWTIINSGYYVQFMSIYPLYLYMIDSLFRRPKYCLQCI
jgi:hypothetical protein